MHPESRREYSIEHATGLRIDGRWELVEGELRHLSPVGYLHALVVAFIAQRLRTFVESEGLGDVLAGDPGFVLRRGPDTLRAPDVCFLRAHRVSALPPRGFVDGAPDLSVEVVSPEDRWPEVERKARQFLEAGAVAVWAIDPERRTARTYTHDGTSTLDEDGVLEEPGLLPGFRLSLRDLP